MAKVQVTMMVKPVSATVVQMRSPTISLTVLSVAQDEQKNWKDRPRSPCIRFHIHFRVALVDGLVQAQVGPEVLGLLLRRADAGRQQPIYVFGGRIALGQLDDEVREDADYEDGERR